MLKGGTLDFILQLKKQGVVRHIGLSSHTPQVVNQALDAGILDMLMFSINPAYDYEQEGEFAIGGVQERRRLYQRCEAEGVGISVMKAFSGGQLLNAKTSPFGRALTEYQCIRYALDKPGVLTVLPGVRNCGDLKRILGFVDAAPEEKDYSVLASVAPQETEGVCVYCNHCQPCPAAWMWGSSINIMILPWPGMFSPGITMQIWRKRPGTASDADIVMRAVPSMCGRQSAWRRFGRILGSKPACAWRRRFNFCFLTAVIALLLLAVGGKV